MMSDRPEKRRRRYIRSINHMPKALILAELFIIILCTSYVLKISGLVLDIANSSNAAVTPVIMLEIDIIFFGLTLFAALGICSHRPESWRKVVRSCVTFTVAMILSAVYVSDSSSHTFDFNPIVTLVALVLLLVIMVTNDKIKKFYTPPMMAVPRTSVWIRYAIWGKLIDTDYRIVFRNTKRKESGIIPDMNVPDELGPLINDIADNHSP